MPPRDYLIYDLDPENPATDHAYSNQHQNFAVYAFLHHVVTYQETLGVKRACSAIVMRAKRSAKAYRRQRLGGSLVSHYKLLEHLVTCLA